MRNLFKLSPKGSLTINIPKKKKLFKKYINYLMKPESRNIFIIFVKIKFRKNHCRRTGESKHSFSEIFKII